MFRSAWIFITLALIVFACAKKSTTTSASSTVSVVAGIDGVWVGECVNASPTSSQEILTFSGNSITRKYFVFDAVNCPAGSYVQEHDSIYTFTSPSTTAAAIPGGSKPIDVVVQSYDIIYYNVSEIFNLGAPWGIGDWVYGESRSILGKEQDGESIDVGDIYYDILLVAGSTLLVGQTYEARSDAALAAASDATRATVFKTNIFTLASTAPTPAAHNTPTPSPTGTPIDVGTVAELQGIWVGACDTTSTTSFQETLTFVNSTVTRRLLNYSAANCPSGQHLNEDVSIYNFTLPSVTSASIPSGAKVMNLNLLTYTKMLPTLAQENTNSYCGYSDWIATQPKSIVGRTCGDYTNSSKQIKFNETFYDIYTLQGQTFQKGLTYGDTSLGLGIGMFDKYRPSALKSVVFTKQ